MTAHRWWWISSVVVALALVDPATNATNAQQRDTAAPDTAPAGPAGAPVMLRAETLFVLQERLGPFSASERAQAVQARLHRLAAAGVDTVVVAPGESGDELLAGTVVLMTVTDADARAAGRDRRELADRFAATLTVGLRESGTAWTIRTIVLGLLYTVLATVALVLLYRLLDRGTSRLLEAVERARRENRLPTLRFQRLEFLSAGRVAEGLGATVRGARVVGIVLLGYFYLTLVLRFFPWTRHLATRIIGYVLDPLTRIGGAIAAYFPKLVVVLVTLFVARIILKLVWLVFAAIERGTVSIAGFDRDWAVPTYKIARFLVLAFVAIVIFPYLPGAQSDAFKGVSLFLGALFTLGSSSAIANVVAGVVLTYTRAFRTGDRVKIGDTTGDVVVKTLLATRVRTIKNVDVTVPNAMVLSSHILNYSAMAHEGKLILHTSVTIGYDAPWRQVHDLLISAAKATPAILKEPAPFVLQSSLDDFYVSYQLNAYTDQAAIMAQTYGLLHQSIQDKFNEAGVEIMSPHYRAARDGNQVAIPPSYLPKDYEAPKFRVTTLRPE